MFVRCFIELAAPFAEVDGALTSDGRAWLPALAASAEEGGERRMAEVGFGKALRVGRQVLVTVGEPARMEFKTLQPISWRPAHSEALLPAMDAEIEVAPMGGTYTQLAMTALYTPPFGLVGKVADRALLHRVAEATIKDFLDRVAARVEEVILADAQGRAGTVATPAAH
jgi:Polyketide cyclase / dehydrase and lipid transport